MPDQITVAEFVAETNEDYKSPTASNFTTRMTHCRNTVTALEEVRNVYLTCSNGVLESSLCGWPVAWLGDHLSQLFPPLGNLTELLGRQILAPLC